VHVENDRANPAAEMELENAGGRDGNVALNTFMAASLVFSPPLEESWLVTGPKRSPMAGTVLPKELPIMQRGSGNNSRPDMADSAVQALR